MLLLAIAGLLSLGLSVVGLAVLTAPPSYAMVYVPVGFIVLLLTLQLGEIAKRARRVSTTTVLFVQAIPCLVVFLVLSRLIWQFRTFAG